MKAGINLAWGCCLLHTQSKYSISQVECLPSGRSRIMSLRSGGSAIRRHPVNYLSNSVRAWCRLHPMVLAGTRFGSALAQQ